MIKTQEEIVKGFNDDPDPLNKQCFDCGERSAVWCSSSFAVLLCLACAGRHRGYGTHISFVQSCTLDQWKEKIRALMSVGGNGRARQYFSQNGLAVVPGESAEAARDRYASPAATRYREMLWDEAMELMGIDPKQERKRLADEQAKYAAMASRGSSSSSSSSAAGQPSGIGNFMPPIDDDDNASNCCLIL